MRYLTQITTQQREQVTFIDLTDPAHALHRCLVIEMTDQSVAGVSGQRDDASGCQELGGLAKQPLLGVVRMNDEVLRHNADCGYRALRCADRAQWARLPMCAMLKP